MSAWRANAPVALCYPRLLSAARSSRPPPRPFSRFHFLFPLARAGVRLLMRGALRCTPFASPKKHVRVSMCCGRLQMRISLGSCVWSSFFFPLIFFLAFLLNLCISVGGAQVEARLYCLPLSTVWEQQRRLLLETRREDAAEQPKRSRWWWHARKSQKSQQEKTEVEQEKVEEEKEKERAAREAAQPQLLWRIVPDREEVRAKLAKQEGHERAVWQVKMDRVFVLSVLRTFRRTRVGEAARTCIGSHLGKRFCLALV